MSDGCARPVRPGRQGWSSPLAVANMVIVGLVLVLNFSQQPGKITFDTKLDLQFDPASFLSRSLNLWNGDWAVGGLQNQASGYLFPMGPVFLLGDVLGVPMWIWERLWSAAIMLLAYEGARRLASSWPGISSAGGVLVGLAYMLSPRVLTTVGGLSGETLPQAVLPWTVLPLVLYLRGRLKGSVAFLLSAATIPWMGGQNATLVVACLLFPALLLGLASGRAWRRRVTDTAMWGGLALVASLWWLLPLLMLGTYAPPFLDFIESADNSAGSTGWLSSLRGTSHWVAFFPGGGGVGWEGGYELAASRGLMVTTVLVAAAGLVGLLQPGLWQRRALVVSVVAGMAVLTAGSGGLAGSVFSEAWLQALDTFLAPLRNVHKFDPVVRLPLSLGLGALVTGAVPRVWASERWRAPVPARRLVTLAAVLLVVAAAQPAASGSLRTTDGMEDIPPSWRAAVDFLQAQAGPVRALVLPGSGFATQTWGRTVDEPIQVLAPPPWLARAQVTVAPGSTLRLIDSVERAVGESRPQQSLSVAVQRLGITHVVVRNDLAREDTDAPSPDEVSASVQGIGARLVAGYGEETGGRSAVEIFAVELRTEPRVDVMDWSERAVVSGGPEVVDDLIAAGLVRADQATVLATDTEPVDIVTDSNRRVERSFGRVHAAVSGVMTQYESFRVHRQRHDFTDEHVPSSTTVAEYDGAAEVVASSSGGYADVLGPVRPEEHPYAAFDQSILTAWASAPLSEPEGQWLEARFDGAVRTGTVTLQFDTVKGVKVTSVRVLTDDGSVAADVAADGSTAAIRLPGTHMSRLRVTVAAADGDGQVRLANADIEGHEIVRTLRLPSEVTADSAVYVSSEQPRRACSTTLHGVSCDQARQLETPETAGFDRTLTVTEPGRWRVAGTAVATHGPAVEQLFAPLDRDLVSVIGSSTYAGDPAVAAANAFDGRPETSWFASPLDPAPAVQLSWDRERTISSVSAQLGTGLPGRVPATLLVDPMTGGQEPQLVATTGPQAGRLLPVRTNQLRVTAVGGTGGEGVGISELVIDDLAGLRHSPAQDSLSGTVCGFGPVIDIGGSVMQTRVSGSLTDVRSGGRLDVVPCGRGAVSLSSGTHRVRVVNVPGFAVSDLRLEPVDAPAGDPKSAPVAQVQSWSPSARTVTVEAAREAVLAVTESVNEGWGAQLDGVRLDPVVVDGWRQAWRVPAGASGTVEIAYEPQTLFRAALVAGLVLAAAISLAAAWVLARTGVDRRRSQPERAGEPPPARERPKGSVRTSGRFQMVSVVLLALVSLPMAAGAVVGRLTRRRPTGAVSIACAVALLLSALIALAQPDSVVVPPVGSDVLAAIVVGVVGGRVLSAS